RCYRRRNLPLPPKTSDPEALGNRPGELRRSSDGTSSPGDPLDALRRTGGAADHHQGDREGELPLLRVADRYHGNDVPVLRRHAVVTRGLTEIGENISGRPAASRPERRPPATRRSPPRSRRAPSLLRRSAPRG